MNDRIIETYKEAVLNYQDKFQVEISPEICLEFEKLHKIKPDHIEIERFKQDGRVIKSVVKIRIKTDNYFLMEYLHKGLTSFVSVYNLQDKSIKNYNTVYEAEQAIARNYGNTE